uniref:EF-hand domain-containing protein n=1 Tax=Amphimedon queenslandica TaxID=400682 RepID=A0A1X7UY17_AMPQE
MSLLLVVVLLFFSSSCSVSSGQYYVSDDCSSVAHNPCHPLSVYAGDMSQYNNNIFYFIGTSDINDDVNMTAVRNVTLHGLDQACLISSRSNERSILIYNSNHVIISNISVYNLGVIARSSNNITITNSSFNGKTIRLNNAFDVKVSSSVFIHYGVYITYKPLPVCSTELPHYSLIVTNVTLKRSEMTLSTYHGDSYNLSAIFYNYHNILHSQSKFALGGSLFYIYIKNSLFQSAPRLGVYYGFFITFGTKMNPKKCKFPLIQLISTFVIEVSQFNDGLHGIGVTSFPYLPRTLSNHFIIIIIKSCLIANNTERGLQINKRFLTLVQINIIDTVFIGNEANLILNSNSISFSNVTFANTRSTGLTLKASVVTIENNLIFKHNTGVVGGGLAINDSSQLIVSSSANLEFISNHASYKGGGIYLEHTSESAITLEAPNIPLTLINNSAGAYGDDIYGYTDDRSNQFNLTNRNISSTGDAQKIHFCTFNKKTSDKLIYPGQALKFHIVLLGYDYFGSLNVTDGIIEIRDGLTPDSAHTVDHVYARSKPGSNCSSPIEYKPNHPPSHVKHAMLFAIKLNYPIFWDYIVNECPIGFSVDSSKAPMKHFELAFKMFDLNGDGEVEFDEFETVQSVLLSSTAMGVRHRDHVINGNVASSVGGALAVHFFGKKLDQKLTIEKFQEFHTLLNTEILLMESRELGLAKLMNSVVACSAKAVKDKLGIEA